MMNLTLTPEREEYINFFGPERTSQMVLVVNEIYEDAPINSTNDLEDVYEKYGLRIGLQTDVEYSPEMTEKLKNKAFYDQFDHTSDVFSYPDNVLNKRIFGFF